MTNPRGHSKKIYNRGELEKTKTTIDTKSGTIYTYGNLSPYITSYIRNQSSPHDLRMETTSLVYASAVVIPGDLHVPWRLAGLQDRARLATMAGSLIMSGGVMLSFFAISSPSGCLSSLMESCLDWVWGSVTLAPWPAPSAGFPSGKVLPVALSSLVMGWEAVLFTYMQTLYINPLNHPLSDSGYFEHPDVLSKVPYSFLIFAARSFGSKHFGTNYGILSTANSLSTAVSAMISMYLLDYLDWFGYFFLVSGFCLAAFVTALLYRHKSLGTIYTYGNLSPYITSYIRNQSSPHDLQIGTTSLVYASAVVFQGVSMFLGGWLDHKIGPRLATMAGSLIMSGGVMLSFFAIKLSFWMLVFTYGVMFGLGWGSVTLALWPVPSAGFPSGKVLPVALSSLVLGWERCYSRTRRRYTLTLSTIHSPTVATLNTRTFFPKSRTRF
eukprot:Em0015g210a